mgnify:CR=1 FL=1|jgi:DNA-binding HTH domain-containing proteins
MADRLSLLGLGPAAREALEREGLPEMFEEFVSAYGLRHAQYISTRAPWFASPVTVGTVPEEKMGNLIPVIFHEIGPLVDKGTSDEIYVNWKDLGKLSEAQAVALDSIMKEFGRTGMSIRLVPKPHSVGLSFTTDVVGDEWKAQAAEVLWKGVIFGHKVHRMVLAAAGRHGRRVELSENQATCLTLLAEGMTVHDISESIGMPESKVMRNLDNARKKLEARNHAHAVAKAIVLGLVAA